MHTALFAASSVSIDLQAWGYFVAFIDAKLKHAKNVQRLAENVWIVNVQDGFGPLAWLVSFAEDRKVPYGILPFDDEPQWLRGGIDPKAIQGRIFP
jgi:hypothetical protein